ncbi:ATP-binding protein, partial [Planotetraspora thailandica]
GLGLAIARQTAETHGGTLRIEDSDRGARFVLRLPRYQEASLA